MTTDYETLQGVLEGAGLPASAAEAHGAACGLLCAGYRDPDAIVALLGDADGDEELRQTLGALLEATRVLLEEGDLAFDLLLPGDEMPAAQRSWALIRWCRGFESGAGRPDLDRLSDEAAEIRADIAAIADAAGTAGEEDLSELAEYLRVGVQLLYEEGNPPAPEF